MKQNAPYSNYNLFSPNYNEMKDFPNMKTPQIPKKNETSEMILSQTKASLNNLLSNLKNASTMNDVLDNKKKKLISTMSNLSRISNIKYPDDGQDLVESYMKLNKIYENKNMINRTNNLFNYNTMNNINTYNQGKKNLSQNNNINKNQNQNQIVMNKLIDNNPIFSNTEGNIGENYMYNSSNTDTNNNEVHNTAKKPKSSSVINKNKIFSEDRKSNKDAKILKNISNKLKKLKIENIKNKNDVFSLKQIYSEMQKILLQEIARYAKTPKEAYLMQISEIQSELNEFKNKYDSLV